MRGFFTGNSEEPEATNQHAGDTRERRLPEAKSVTFPSSLLLEPTHRHKHTHTHTHRHNTHTPSQHTQTHFSAGPQTLRFHYTRVLLHELHHHLLPKLPRFFLLRWALSPLIPRLPRRETRRERDVQHRVLRCFIIQRFSKSPKHQTQARSAQREKPASNPSF